ncbi:MAG: PDZ domain-containing protein [Actinomycetes bacterium]
MSRRAATFSVAATLLAVLLLVTILIPVPYVELSPGPTFNTIGSFQGKQLITITKTTTFPTSGHLDMVTVSETGGAYGGLTFGQALFGQLQSGTVVLPRSLLYPANQTSDQAQQQGAEEFTASQSAAIGAALHYLGIPVTEQVYVSSVVNGAPASGKLHAGDVLLAIDGTKVVSADQVGTLVRAHHPGDRLTIEVDRDGDRVSVVVVTAKNPQDSTRTYIGILGSTMFTGPFPIKFQLDDVGGPSAGLMFALGIIDRLTPGPVNGGGFVAGTGTISPDGTVGAIGGIGQKVVAARVAGATLFLAPKQNCSDLAGVVQTGITVAAVGNLVDAMNAIAAWRAGKAVVACQS